MYRLIAALFVIATIATIDAVPVWEDFNGNSYYLIPVEQEQVVEQRHKRAAGGFERQTTYDIRQNHVGLGQKFTLDGDNHKFSGEAYGSRDYKPKGPLTTGFGAEYEHKGSGSNFKIGTENTRGQGTDLSASGTYNFFQTQDKRGKIGVGGEYQRHYGGPFGTSGPNYNVFLRGRYDF